jgi:hypothetical protein
MNTEQAEVEYSLWKQDRRDRFAAAALTGLLSDSGEYGIDPKPAAKAAVQFADALIAELDK